MKNLILATIISSSLLIADNGVALPEYDLVKKDFINGEINNERLSQIILKDPRLVPKSRGGLKDDVDANSDGLGVLVIGKILNGSVDSIELQNDNRNVNNKLNYLIKKYGDDAKSAGMSTIDYVKNGVQTGVLSGDEAETIKSKLSRNDIVSLSMSSSNTSPKISDIITISTTIVGNDDDSNINYNWTSSENVNIESDNGDNIIVSFNKPGPFTIEVTANDVDNSKSQSLNGSSNANSIGSIEDAYDSASLKSEGFAYITDLAQNVSWDGTYWKNESNEIERYSEIIDNSLPVTPPENNSAFVYRDDGATCNLENHYTKGKHCTYTGGGRTQEVKVSDIRYKQYFDTYCKEVTGNDNYVAIPFYEYLLTRSYTLQYSQWECVLDTPASCSSLGLIEHGNGECLGYFPN